MATMRFDLLHGLVTVHGDGSCLSGNESSGSCRTAALQVVCSLALWWVVAGMGDGSRWAVQGDRSLNAISRSAAVDLPQPGAGL